MATSTSKVRALNGEEEGDGVYVGGTEELWDGEGKSN